MFRICGQHTPGNILEEEQKLHTCHYIIHMFCVNFTYTHTNRSFFSTCVMSDSLHSGKRLFHHVIHAVVLLCTHVTDLGATVYFSQSSYSITETEGVLQVCASISVWTDFNVSVGVESESITADGKS